MLFSSYLPYLLLFTFIAFIVIIIRLFTEKKRSKKTTEDLHRANSNVRILQKRIDELEDSHRHSFDSDLNEVQLTTSLQSSRISIYKNLSSESPERYKYVRSMLKNGMTADEISKILEISIQEATQLETLSKMTLEKDVS